MLGAVLVTLIHVIGVGHWKHDHLTRFDILSEVGHKTCLFFAGNSRPDTVNTPGVVRSQVSYNIVRSAYYNVDRDGKSVDFRIRICELIQRPKFFNLADGQMGNVALDVWTCAVLKQCDPCTFNHLTSPFCSLFIIERVAFGIYISYGEKVHSCSWRTSLVRGGQRYVDRSSISPRQSAAFNLGGDLNPSPDRRDHSLLRNVGLPLSLFVSLNGIKSGDPGEYDRDASQSRGPSPNVLFCGAMLIFSGVLSILVFPSWGWPFTRMLSGLLLIWAGLWIAFT